MKKIKEIIIRGITKIVYRNFDGISAQHNTEKLNKIKLLPNVKIDPTSGFRDTSEIYIIGQLKELIINKNVQFLKFCNIVLEGPATLLIHENVFFNNYCSVNCQGRIEIGENSIFGEGVRIYDHNHDFSFDERKTLKVERDKFRIGQVIIGKNCWVGSNVTILNNVEIGDNVIIGANCLIYKSIPSNTIVKANVSYHTSQL